MQRRVTLIPKEKLKRFHEQNDSLSVRTHGSTGSRSASFSGMDLGGFKEVIADHSPRDTNRCYKQEAITGLQRRLEESLEEQNQLEAAFRKQRPSKGAVQAWLPRQEQDEAPSDGLNIQKSVTSIVMHGIPAGEINRNNS